MNSRDVDETVGPRNADNLTPPQWSLCLDSNLPPLQVVKKAISIAAVVVDYRRAKSLLGQGLFELCNHDTVIM